MSVVFEPRRREEERGVPHIVRFTTTTTTFDILITAIQQILDDRVSGV